MLTQRTQILAALAERGWRLAGTLDSEWWADEILVLESGRQIFLTFR